ncbi:nitrate- and nitrite sensing domain-containing protein [Cryptosporangium phraense]|uniref:histidine kinase n=1 Tax=Cryptosporangium phraense TaxID=2593070 RepID=A0A545AKW9_9ACTN|nr:nitrate- and nitrite sensing domain-containing protein [Cryptosporangium phraense]TQS41966.1 HAMP domain-containing protein [Cryptosporangium phraense]
MRRADSPQRSGSTIGRRIVRTLALPVVAALVLLIVIAGIQVGNYTAAAATARAVTLDLAVQDLVQELQTERGVTAGLLGGNAGFRAELARVRDRVDDERTAVERLVEDGGAVEDRVADALRDLEGLAGVRAGADTGGAARAATFTFYTARIAQLSNVDFGLDSSTDGQLRSSVTALQALADVKEATAQERAFLNGVFSASGFGKGEFLQFVTMRSAKDAALQTFTRYAPEDARASMSYVLDTGAAREATYFETVALNAGDGRPLQVNPQSWWSALTTVLDDMLSLQQHVGSVIRARAETLQNGATVRVAVLLAAVLLSVVGSIYLAFRASRSIARPLAALAGEANRLAGRALPDAVRRASAGDDAPPPPPVLVSSGSTEEVRQVADAFDRVQATAYALATEQARLRRSSAESLANLGRRNQNLLRRQLGFITRLEREESDPTGLANLFELDHLATRMRRNAESLLVLVGAASPRQWSQPLPVADVIRAAVSEVEEYRRVTLRRVDDIQVAGSVVSGIAHMLAELIENGLSFSPPDEHVEIHGRRLGDGYLIAVFDQGIGLNPAEIERANQRLRGEGDFITAPARFLGHYVVGRLAADMGISVQLAPSPVTGVTARITLPPSMLSEPPAVEVPGPAEPTLGRRLQLHQAIADGTGARRFPAAVPEPRWAPPVSPAPMGAGPVGAPLTVESVVVAGPLPVPSQRPGSPEVPAYSTLKAPSSLGVDLYTVEPVDDAVERTTNGLRKRTPRARRATTTTGAHPTITAPPAGERPALLNESPDALRARLAAFRDGVHRGTSSTSDEGSLS